MSPYLAPPSITATRLNLLFVFSVWAVCESCIEPIPTCSHGEILAVDLNTTNSCCPQYHCGKCVCVCVCVLFIYYIYTFSHVLQCVMLTCALNHLWAVHLVSLWFKLVSLGIAAHSITAVHAQKHPHTFIHTHTCIHMHPIFLLVCVDLMIGLISEIVMPVTYLHKLHATCLFNSLSVTLRMPMWGQLSPHLSGGKSAKSCITSHCLIRSLLEGRKSEQIQLSQHSVFSQGEVLVEVPGGSTDCGCPQHTCRMWSASMKAHKTHTWH